MAAATRWGMMKGVKGKAAAPKAAAKANTSKGNGKPPQMARKAPVPNKGSKAFVPDPATISAMKKDLAKVGNRFGKR